MTTKLIAACLVAGALALPTVGIAAIEPPKDAASTEVSSEPAPQSSMQVTTADLTPGTPVMDAVGATLGEIGSVNPGATEADTMVMLTAHGRSVSVPASSLMRRGGVLVSSQTKADVWKPN